MDIIRNKENESHLNIWQFYSDSYVGGSQYKEGAYLYKHENETELSFSRRQNMACFVNYCAPVIDIYNSYLFRENPVRDFGNINTTVLNMFRKNADNNGRRYHKVIREVSRQASIFGFMGIIIDKPMSNGEASRQEEIANGIIPYLSVYNPSSIINWKREKINGKSTLSMLVLKEEEIQEGVEQFKIWYPYSWELWEKQSIKNSTKKKMVMVDSGENPLGIIPFVIIKNRDTFEFMEGISDLSDIADINKNIYYYDSDAMEIIDRTAFPFLEEPVDSLGNTGNGDIEVGTGNVLQRDIADTLGHRWIEPSHSSLSRILEWRNQAVNDIQTSAKMESAEGSNKRITNKSESGSAMEMRFQQLNAVLSDKAENMEVAEEDILTLVALWDNIIWNGSIRYARKFGIRDLVTDLDNALRSQKSISSVEFNIVMQQHLAGRLVSDFGVENKEYNKIMADIRRSVPLEPGYVSPNDKNPNRGPSDPILGANSTGKNNQGGSNIQ